MEDVSAAELVDWMLSNTTGASALAAVLQMMNEDHNNDLEATKRVAYSFIETWYDQQKNK